jgi:hypothetical protein
MLIATLLEQYKAYIADLGNIGTRYTTAQSFYLSVVSALTGVVAFFAKDAGALQKYIWVVALMMIFIALICYVWLRTLDFYEKLFQAKFAVLKSMEAASKGDLFNVYSDESNKLDGARLINHEKALPVIVGLAALVGLVISGWTFFHS